MQRRFSRRKKDTTKRFRANAFIRAHEIVVIDADGEHRGVMKTADALQLAQESDLDLIEVSPLAQPPVCRIMSLGQWQYQQSQKQKKSKTLDTKVVRLTFKIGEHDKEVRRNQILKFLEKGHKVKIELRLKGREKAYPSQARDMVNKFIAELPVPIQTEQAVSMMGMTVNALISKKG